MRAFFSMDQSAVAPYYDWFDRALATRQPALAALLQRTGVPFHDKLIAWLQVRCGQRSFMLQPDSSALVMCILQTVFVTLLPLSTAVRVWDMFLLEGTPYLMRTALAIFDLLAPELSSSGADDVSDRIQVRTFLRSLSDA
jgi:hypothetical protein